jgi:hypothetical protein
MAYELLFIENNRKDASRVERARNVQGTLRSIQTIRITEEVMIQKAREMGCEVFIAE